MCTVTYIPAKDGVYITSNRDEQGGRPSAAEPAIVAGRTGRLLFPRDTRAGGSWFVVHERGAVLVLLNGAGERHIPQPPYRKSRGLILLDLAESLDSFFEFKMVNLNGIEPFTLILLENGCLYECRWDGVEKAHRPIDVAIPHIWSSVTLYDPAIRQKRREWFDTWLQDNPAADQEKVLQFHQFAGGGDSNLDVLRSRRNLLKDSGEKLTNGKEGLLTVSVTSLQIADGNARMQYLDILSGSACNRELLFTQRGTPALPAEGTPLTLSIPAII